MDEAPYHTPEQMGENERFFHEKLLGDLQKLPDAIIVDESARKAGLGEMKFDFIRYLSLDVRFSELWSHYSFVQRIEGSHNLAIYARKQ